MSEPNTVDTTIARERRCVRVDPAFVWKVRTIRTDEVIRTVLKLLKVPPAFRKGDARDGVS